MSGMRPKRSSGKFKKRPEMSLEKKIESFILRNSRNGYFTKFSTITSKFDITESETWNIIGLLLSEGGLETMHDPVSGEMKICEADKKYEVLNMGKKRKFEKQTQHDKSGSQNFNNNNNKNNNNTKDNNSNSTQTKNSNKPDNNKTSGRRMGRDSNRLPNRRGASRGSGSGRYRGHVSRNESTFDAFAKKDTTSNDKNTFQS